MQVSVEKTGDLERRLTVQVAADDVNSKVNSRLAELRKQVKLKGFRPGKVPMNVVEQRYGRQVWQEVTQQVMQSSLQEAIGEQALRVAGVSSLEPASEAPEGENFEFTAEIEVFPEVGEIDVTDLKIEKPAAEVADSDVDDMIETLREQRRTWSDAGRAAGEGDRVRIEYSAELDDKRVPEIGHHELAPVLGSGTLFEDFEKAISGNEAGHEGTVELEFPETFRSEELAGKKARVTFRIVSVEASELPELNDEFAESFGIDGGVEQMRADVRRNLERELRQALLSRLKQAVTDAISERFDDLTMPAASIRQEAQQMQAQVQQQSGGNDAVPLEQFTQAAEKRVKLGFLMSEIARQNKIELDQERVDAQVKDLAETYEQPEQIVQMYRSNPQLMEGVHNMVLEEQVIDWVLDRAVVSEKKLSFKEVLGQS